MSRLFSRQSRYQHYNLLDDSADFQGDNSSLDSAGPQNNVSGTLHHPIEDDTETSDTGNDLNFEGNQIWIIKALKGLRLPRINYSSSICQKCVFTGKKQTACDIALCIFVLVTVLSVCLSLGYYTLFIKEPGLVIDKSYSAFRIPNHEASLNYGALQHARRNHTSFVQIQYTSLLKTLKAISNKKNTEQNLNSSNHISDPIHGNSHNGNKFGRGRRSSLGVLQRRRRRSNNGNSVVSANTQYYPQWKMQVVFIANTDDNIFTRDRLQGVHDVEMSIIQHESYSDFCYKDSHQIIHNDPAVKAYNGCAPLNSLLTYLYPSRDGKGNVFYDGLGDNMDNMDSALKWAMTSTHFYYYVDDKVNSTFMKSKLVRTEVLFGAPLKGFHNRYINRDVQSQKFKDFVITYIELLSKASSKDVTVLYGGREIFDYEVEATFWNDIQLAMYSLISICVLMLVLTSGSLWLTVWGIICILLSAPLALFFYRVVFNVRGLGILNGAAAFVIIGIGVDDVFVFINVFRQASHVTEARGRTLYTVKTAGISTFFTSFTTAAAFAANIASMIPAVHDFGLFMALIVAMCWCTVVLVMPPVLYIWYIAFGPCEQRIARCLCSCLPSCKSSSLALPDDVAQFMDSTHSNVAHVTLDRQVTDEDADVPMLSMDSPIYYTNDGDDDMLMVDPDPLTIPEDAREPRARGDNQLGSKLQGLLYHGLVVPIIKARWVIIVISGLLLCMSIGFVTQLSVSTQPPQFFRADTNMQKLLNLKAKFSAIDTVQCYDCSAIYSTSGKARETVPPQKHYTIPRRPKATTESSQPIKTQHTTQTPPTTHAPYTWKPRPTTKAPSYTQKWRTIPKRTYATTPKPKFTPKPAGFTRKPSGFTPHPTITPKPKPLPVNYDVCKDKDCSHPKQRPLMESGATVYVVLGVKTFKWGAKNVQHVMSDNVGELTYDTRFTSMYNFSNLDLLDNMRQLCTVCKQIAKNTQLVRNGSAQCLPIDSIPYTIKKDLIYSLDECKDLPQSSYIYGGEQPAHALGSLTSDGSAILWLAFAFESTTSKGKSYFEAYKAYEHWEKFLTKVKQGLDPHSPLVDMFQTSEFWPEVLMEIVAVNSAIYSVVLSMVICMVAVMIFTRHILLLLIIFISIAEMVCLVVAIFYILGWEIGGVEAISLSILVGSSVDYCVHLVEGYVLAAQACPIKDNAVKARHWRTSAAFSHIGVSIISSALTTIIAAIPLTQTTIQPFAKFGQIIAINTSVCIVYSLTVCTALLSTMAPAFFKPTLKSTVKSLVGTAVVCGTTVLIMFIVSKVGHVTIPGPNGGSLFPN